MAAAGFQLDQLLAACAQLAKQPNEQEVVTEDVIPELQQQEQEADQPEAVQEGSEDADDLYADLQQPTGVAGEASSVLVQQQQEQIQQLQTTVAAQEAQLLDLYKQLADRDQQVHELSSQRLVLLTNLSSLFKTAQAELKRHAAQLASTRVELATCQGQLSRFKQRVPKGSPAVSGSQAAAAAGASGGGVKGKGAASSSSPAAVAAGVKQGRQGGAAAAAAAAGASGGKGMAVASSSPAAAAAAGVKQGQRAGAAASAAAAGRQRQRPAADAAHQFGNAHTNAHASEVQGLIVDPQLGTTSLGHARQPLQQVQVSPQRHQQQEQSLGELSRKRPRSRSPARSAQDPLSTQQHQSGREQQHRGAPPPPLAQQHKRQQFDKPAQGCGSHDGIAGERDRCQDPVLGHKRQRSGLSPQPRAQQSDTARVQPQQPHQQPRQQQLPQQQEGRQRPVKHVDHQQQQHQEQQQHKRTLREEEEEGELCDDKPARQPDRQQQQQDRRHQDRQQQQQQDRRQQQDRQQRSQQHQGGG